MNSVIHESVDDRANRALTPSEKDQLVAILKGECPHNGKWEWVSYGHNSSAYRCSLCGKLDFY